MGMGVGDDEVQGGGALVLWSSCLRGEGRCEARREGLDDRRRKGGGETRVDKKRREETKRKAGFTGGGKGMDSTLDCVTSFLSTKACRMRQ
jgi:hypothetical protein